MAREVFQRYFKLTRRALSDAAAVAAAAAAGISTRGDLRLAVGDVMAALEAEEEEASYHSGRVVGSAAAAGVDVAADWGAGELLQALYVVKNDLSRLDGLLPELSPKDRGLELVEHSVRQHVGLCFAALERRLLGSVEALGAALRATPDNCAFKADLLAQGLVLLQRLVVQGAERLVTG